MKTIYVLVEIENVCCGHGDYRDKNVIPDGHPAFGTEKEAYDYRRKVDRFNFLKVKTLELRS